METNAGTGTRYKKVREYRGYFFSYPFIVRIFSISCKGGPFFRISIQQNLCCLRHFPHGFWQCSHHQGWISSIHSTYTQYLYALEKDAPFFGVALAPVFQFKLIFTAAPALNDVGIKVKNCCLLFRNVKILPKLNAFFIKCSSFQMQRFSGDIGCATRK